jgi:predicted ribosome quality control (RQC) complex YloA/Tae2 family protein
MEHPRVIILEFSSFRLVLDARTESPDFGFLEPGRGTPPRNPAWEHHLKGAVVTGVGQTGLDRVLVIEFSGASVYRAGTCSLRFEMTGRNANLVLVREPDRRIIACLRKVGPELSRIRTVAPGAVYTPPPPSGLPLESWAEVSLPENPEPADLYRALEGVGPLAASAVLARSARLGRNPGDVLMELAAELSSERIPEWLGKAGPERPEPGKQQAPAVAELASRLAKERKDLVRKAAAASEALAKLESPDTFREWGNLILAGKEKLSRGMDKAELAGFSGPAVEIPLKRALTPVENAARFFRKASGVRTERERLEAGLERTAARLEEIAGLLSRLRDLTPTEAASLLARPRADRAARKPREYILQDGWRCLAGRNARENEELTFRVAARDDFWLHARGASGSHVILRREGRPGNPPERVLQEAARIAALHSGQKGIIPVDCTLVKHVRRVKGAPRGFVAYTREKTIFAEVE